MAFHVDDGFARRMSRLERTHAKLRRGAVTEMRKDGLLVMRPKRAHGLLRVLKATALVVAGGIAFKTFMLASLGPATYQDRLSLLVNGTLPEQYAAHVMAIDPATQWLTDQINAAREGRL